jgi:fatty-acyl-CoA synthase
VADAVVVGIPDERWGEAVTAIVELHGGARAGADELREFVKQRLAAYKAPKAIVLADSVGRAPSGKVDYKAAKKRVREALGATS